jgi:hypothetical protein
MGTGRSSTSARVERAPGESLYQKLMAERRDGGGPEAFFRRTGGADARAPLPPALERWVTHDRGEDDGARS